MINNHNKLNNIFMKHFTLFKPLLVVAAMLLGGANYLWADNMTTMTGLLGLADNSNGFAAYKSKAVTLAAGESYVYTFVNYNKGTSGTDEWENWSVEATNGSAFLDFRADGGFWGELPSAANYAGSVWSDVSATKTTWLEAYNGVTVTVTVSRSNDGTTFTVAHTATTNTSLTYAGTYTATISAEDNITFYLTNEDSHQQITKVVYTSDNNGAVYVAPDHTAGAQWGSNTGASTVDAEKEHYNNDASSSWAGCAYAKFSYSELPDGATLTGASVTYSVNQGGKSGRNDVIYYMAKDFDLDWANFAGQTGTDLRNISSRGGTAVAAAATGATGDRFNLSQSVLGAVSAIYEAGQKYILLQWTGNAGGADLYGKGSAEHAPELSILYTMETTYTATFTENNSLVPTVKIYSDSERTSEVANGTLTDGTTYYYRATLAGYFDCDGSFTISGSDPDVNFTMTAKAVYSYTVKAYAGGNLLGTIASGSYTEGDAAVEVYYPRFIQSGTTLYSSGTGAVTYSTTFTPDEDDYVQSVNYNSGTIQNVAFYTDAEDVSGVTVAYSNKIRASKGLLAHTGSASTYKDASTLAPGKYILYMRAQNGNNDPRAFSFKVGETEVLSGSFDKGTNKDSNSEEFTVSTTSTLSFASEGSGQSGIDYFYVVKTGEVATIGSTGWTTFASAYPLDLSDMSASTGSVTAFYASAVRPGWVTMTSTESTGVAAGEGIMLQGTAGATITIPVVTSGTAIAGNLLVGCTTSTSLTANANYYVLVNNDGAEFQSLEENGATIPAGKAYLDVSDAGVKGALRIVFDDSVTSINAIDNEQLSIDNGQIYNLAGQRMSKMHKGINIVNGKKVIIK